MKVTLKELFESEQALVYLAQNPLLSKLNEKVILKFNNIINTISLPLEEFRVELSDLIKEYGVKQDDETYKIDDDKLDDFKKAQDKIYNKEIEIDFTPFKPKDFNTSILLPAHLQPLQKWMINE